MKHPDEENNFNPQDQPTPGIPGAGKPLDNDRAAPKSFPADDLSALGAFQGVHIPSFPVDETAEEPEFDFSSHPNPEEMEFIPLPVNFSPDEPAASPPPRRRRRQNRLINRPEAHEISLWLESMAQRATPTFDFFVFSMLAGGILGIGYLLDAQAVLLLGILVAPILAPWMGATLAVAIGEWRFFGQTTGGFFTAVLMIFGTGILAGLASRIWQPHTFDQAFLHSRLWVPDLLVLIIGTIALTVFFIQSGEKPVIASIMVAYELFLPVSAAGFGLGSTVEGLWPQSLLVFLIHLAISMALSLIVFYYMGFRPLDASGYILALLIVVLGLAITAGFAGIGTLFNFRGNLVTVTPTASVVVIPTASPAPVKSATFTPQPTFTFTPRPTRVPVTPTLNLITPTPVVTFPSPTIVPTPIYGRVQSKGDGAVIRTEPGGSAITTVQNGYLVEILPDPPVVFNGAIWVHVIIRTQQRDLNGWVLFELIVTATPSVASP